MHSAPEALHTPRSTPPNPFDPGSRAFVWGVGDLLAQDSPREALKLCQGGVEAHPHFVSGWLMMARVLAALGEASSALEWLEALLSLSPTHRGACRLKATLAPAVIPSVQPAPPSPSPTMAEPSKPKAAAMPSPAMVALERPEIDPPFDGASDPNEGILPAPPSLSELPGARDLRALLGGMGGLWRELGDAPESAEALPFEEPESAPRPTEPSALVSETLGKLYLAQGADEAARDIFSRLAKARGGEAKKGLPLGSVVSPKTMAEARPGVPPLTEDERVIEALLAWSHHFDEGEAHL